MSKDVHIHLNVSEFVLKYRFLGLNSNSQVEGTKSLCIHLSTQSKTSCDKCFFPATYHSDELVLLLLIYLSRARVKFLLNILYLMQVLRQ